MKVAKNAREYGQLVGVSGYKGSGKDAAVRGLVENGWHQLAFADRIKDFAYLLKGVWVQVTENVLPSHPEGGFYSYQYVIDEIGMDEAKVKVLDVRRLLQTLGTDAGRKVIGDSIWVAPVMEEAQKLRSRGVGVVITDVRYPNEVDAIRGVGGVIGRVFRGSKPSSKKPSSKKVIESSSKVSPELVLPAPLDVDTHISESSTKFLEYDFYVSNDGTIKELQEDFEKLVEGFR